MKKSGLLPVDTKLWSGPYFQELFHVRGHVDGRMVIRHWRRSKKVWRYEVISSWEVEMGAYKLKRPPMPKLREGIDHPL